MRKRAAVEPSEFPSFRFSAEDHSYICMVTGEEIPHITGLLTLAGHINDEWFTEEGRMRGSAVHSLTAAFDLGALDAETCASPFKPYLLAHVKLMSMLRPEWLHIEEPMVHHRPRFGGRADRVGILYKAISVVDEKTGQPKRSDQIQTALQAILVAPRVNLPPRGIQRYGEYLRSNGKGHIEQFTNPADFDTAYGILDRFCA